jgi:hypothetical protein
MAWDRTAFYAGRPLPPRVAATLEVLLVGEEPAFVALRRQIPFARGVSGCLCGCPSVGMEVDRSAVPPAPSGETGTVDGWYDDRIHDVVLFIEDGYLSSVELNSVSDDVPTDWPDPAILDPSPRRR